MLRARHLCCASLVVSVVSCASQSASSDQSEKSGKSDKPGGDPWSASGKSGDKNKDPDKDQDQDSGVPFDLKSGLSKIADSISKPGPYEAPEKSKQFDPGKPHWGVLRLDGAIVEREALSLTGGRGLELRALIDRLRELASDDKLTGLVLRVGAIQISLPDAAELRAAIHDVRKAGKTVACTTEGAASAEYMVLVACDRISVAPLGEVAITGPTALPIHVKQMLDKLGVQADFLHIGAYKGAAEPLTRDAPSKEMEETLGAILDRRYQTMVDVIATERKLPAATVKGLIDTALFTAEQARAANLVDAVLPYDTFRDEALKGAPWTRLELDPTKHDRFAMIVKLWRFLGAMPPDKPSGGHVALVYALGTIVNGSGEGVLGARHEIAANTLVAAIRALAADDSVKAVVLRIDSGGGSAQASEMIWRALTDLQAAKPLVVSMSDVAASGGYYIACGASKIFALEDTLTGSIGVVGGKIAVRDGLGRLGIHAYPMGRGKRATIATSLAPWTDDERAAIRSSMEDVYRVFVERVAGGRHKKPDDIQPIAQGRVWTGAKAKDLGLVDEIGGLDAALAEARRMGKVDAKAELEVFPPAPTLRDLFVSFGEVQAPLGVSSDAALSGLAGVDRALASLVGNTALRFRSAASPGGAGLVDHTALPFGSAASPGGAGLVDPAVAAAAEQLIQLVFSFRASTIQAVAMLPVIQ